MKESKIKPTRKKKVQFILTAEAEYHKEKIDDLTDLEAFANLYYTENDIKTVLNEVFQGKNFSFKSYLTNLEFADCVGKHVTE